MKVTGLPEAPPVAVSAIGVVLNVTGEVGAKVMVCDAWTTVMVIATCGAAE